MSFSLLTCKSSNIYSLSRLSATHWGFRKPRGQRSWTFLSYNNSSVTVHSLNTSFPYIWLRDSCQSPDCVHPSTSQKLHATSDIPLDVEPVPGGVKVIDEGLSIEWNTGHKSIYPRSFLERYSSPSNVFAFHKDVLQERWNASILAQVSNLYLSYKSLETPSGLLAAITQLTRYGILFVTGVPNEDTTDENCELRTLAGRFGEIRETFYGQVWNVKNLQNSRNIAYTNLDLGMHMDLLYFQHPPRYQILHCLRNRVTGGTSVFVDALDVASILRSNYPSKFKVLSSTPVAFHYINDGHHLHYEHPTIQLSDPSPFTPSSSSPPDASTNQEAIDHINYSPPFQAPLPLTTPREFYPALGRFAQLLNEPGRTFKYTLKEGDAVLFDNRRVLHSRTAFHDIEGEVKLKEGETNRWLKGCYLEADALLDRARVLRSK